MDDNIDNETPQTPDIWSLMTWLASAILAYLILSGALIFWLEFGVYAQYSVIVHTVIGLVAIGPVSWLVWKHWRRRDGTVSGAPALLARLSIPALVLCLASGVVISLQAAFGTSVSALAWLTHQLLALIFAVIFVAHLVPVLLRFTQPNPTPRRLVRPRFLLFSVFVLILPLAATHWLSAGVEPTTPYRAIPDLERSGATRRATGGGGNPLVRRLP